MNLQDAMANATSYLMAEFNLSELRCINLGFCDDWVEKVLKHLDKNVLACGWWLDGDSRLTFDESMDIAHCVLWCEGKFYDCLCADGAEDPLDLVLVPEELTKDFDEKTLKQHNKYKKELKSIKERGNPPDLLDYADRTTLEWGKII